MGGSAALPLCVHAPCASDSLSVFVHQYVDLKLLIVSRAAWEVGFFGVFFCGAILTHAVQIFPALSVSVEVRTVGLVLTILSICFCTYSMRGKMYETE